MSERYSLGAGRFRARIRSIRRAKNEFSFSPSEWQQIEECSYCRARPAARYGVQTPGGRMLWSGGCGECAEMIARDTGGSVVRVG